MNSEKLDWKISVNWDSESIYDYSTCACRYEHVGVYGSRLVQTIGEYKTPLVQSPLWTKLAFTRQIK